MPFNRSRAWLNRHPQSSTALSCGERVLIKLWLLECSHYATIRRRRFRGVDSFSARGFSEMLASLRGHSGAHISAFIAMSATSTVPSAARLSDNVRACVCVFVPVQPSRRVPFCAHTSAQAFKCVCFTMGMNLRFFFRRQFLEQGVFIRPERSVELQFSILWFSLTHSVTELLCCIDTYETEPTDTSYRVVIFKTMHF